MRWPRFPAMFKGGPRKDAADHYTRCPMCGHLVDELDLEEVMQHLDPHEAPPKKH